MPAVASDDAADVALPASRAFHVEVGMWDIAPAGHAERAAVAGIQTDQELESDGAPVVG